MKRNLPKEYLGFSLIELVMAIAISALAMSGLMAAFSSVAKRSSDPMVMQQGLIIAESLMEEILLQPFFDPSSGTACPSAPSNRVDFNNVCDYNGYSSATITDISGTSYSQLSGYSISVSVSNSATGQLGAVATASLLRVDVTVSNPLGSTVKLTSYRTNY